MRSSPLTATSLLVLFCAALVANIRLAGTSPILWIDTFNDDLEVRQCLADDSCTLTGVSTSVPGQAHGVAWLELRTLFAWLGVGVDGTHLAIQVGNALAVVLVFHLATTLSGPIAGALAAWLLLDGLDTFVRTTALYNSSPMLFFGTAFALACTAVTARPGIVSVTLAAAIAAIMTNLHLACAMTGASVVLVALAAPRRRWLWAAYAGVMFAVATFAIAPPTWQHNLLSARQGRAHGHLVALDVPYNAMLSWALFAFAAWAASFLLRTPGARLCRRRMIGTLAVMVPSLAVFVIAPRYGFNPEPKYIFHLKAACAIAAAVPIATVANALLRLLPAQPTIRAGLALLPFVLSLALALPGRFAARAQITADNDPMPTMSDIMSVARILRTDLGWGADEILRNLKSPGGVTLLAGLRPALAEETSGPGGSTSKADSAALLVLALGDIPNPLPSRWRIVRQTSKFAVVLLWMQSRIDWHTMTVCVRAADEASPQCNQTTWQPQHELVMQHLPPGGAGWRGTLRVSMPLRANANGLAHEIFMPRMEFVCAGRVVSYPDGTVSADGRRVTDVAVNAGAAAVVFEWELGAPGCDGTSYDGGVPFFVEGDAPTVRLVADMLLRHEGGH